ncbi:hypothetical protein ACLVWU_06765 [Bdellovibrio sp. HCB290]|uniref:hypothetical protein n=1 Tax=Bdellovibrio sp. HCB290 TaxID=3394356 RepID=UPI0039B50B5B
MSNRNSKIAVVVGSVLVAVSVFSYFKYFHDPVLAKVGETKITKSDVAYRDKIIRLSYPEEKRSMGLYQLMNSAIHYEVLKSNGVQISEDVIDQEMKRIDDNTRNPEQLKSIKSIFKEDAEAYRRVFVLPTLVDRVIHFDFFLNDEKTQEASIKPPLEFINAIKNGRETFRSRAKKQNIEIVKAKISAKDGVVWEKSGNDLSASEKDLSHEAQAEMEKVLPKRDNAPSASGGEYQKWQQILAGLEPGQMVPLPLNYGELWLVILFEKKTSPTSFEIVAGAFPKLEYGKWLASEKSKLEIEIYDKTVPSPK